MAADVAVFLFFALFQLAGAVALFRRKLNERREPVLILVALLALNGTLSLFAAIASSGGPTGAYSDLTLGIDGPSGVLILAFFFSWRRWTVATRVALVLAVVVGLVVFLADDPLRRALDTPLVSGPYYVGLATVIFSLARGNETERWIALAFVPRAMLFFGQTIIGVVRYPDFHGWVSLPFFPLQITALGIVSLLGVWRLARSGSAPSPHLVIACVLLGPADALAWILASDAGAGSATTTFLNHLTLTLARPLLLYVALAPLAVRAIVGRTLFAGGIAASIVVGAAWLALPSVAAAVVAFSLGSFVLALLSTGPVGAPGEAVKSAVRVKGAPADPHWVLLMRALQGSSQGEPSAAWTQKNLAMRTGVSVKRVSAFAEDLNGSAARKLDAHLPDWRQRVKVPPVLVVVHKGAVHGLGGSWVYYRLTPLGEELAASLPGHAPDERPLIGR